MDQPTHLPVLLQETLALLAPRPGEVYLDCTAGLGGHAALVAERIGPTGTVVLNDLDAGNLERSTARVKAVAGAPRVISLQGSFAELPRKLVELALRADMLLADLGFASNQVDDPARGLAFSRDGPLDMRLDPSRGPTAADFVNSMSEQELARVIADFGEERHARRVAARIVEARRAGPITTTAQFADLVRSVVPRVPGPDGGRGIDPATRTFQGLRIAVNDELGHLDALLASLAGPTDGSRAWLNPGARVAFITFHSLEDRPVKRAFGDLVASGAAEELTRKPVTAGPEESHTNPRARSGKLRGLKLR